MRNSQEISCPECGHEFRPIDSVWRVCNDCLQIMAPDETRCKHDGSCIKRLGSYTIAYDESGAKELQEKKLRQRRGIEMTFREAKRIVNTAFAAGSVEDSDISREKYETAVQVVNSNE